MMRTMVQTIGTTLRGILTSDVVGHAVIGINIDGNYNGMLIRSMKQKKMLLKQLTVSSN